MKITSSLAEIAAEIDTIELLEHVDQESIIRHCFFHCPSEFMDFTIGEAKRNPDLFSVSQAREMLARLPGFAAALHDMVEHGGEP